MPRELPGFYFDEEKKRYFPLSSKPAGTPRSSNPSRSSSHQHASDSQLGRTAQPLASVSSITVSHGLKRKRANVCWDESESLRRSAPGSLQSRRCMHEIICANIVSTSLATKVPVPDPTHSSITAFRTANIDGRVRMFYGDTNGWLYSFNDYNVDDTSIQTPQSDHRPMGCWVPELSLTSEISSICISDSRCIATSFGPACRILVQDLSSADTFILNPGSSYMHDIWTSHLRGRNLALGSNKKAIFVKDIDAARSLDILDTQSDVYAVEQQENLVYTGARNGSISRFDMRLDDLRGQNLLDDAFKTQGNSVTNLNIIREWQLVVGSINGSLAAYDLRFSRRSTPLMTFSGHKNSYTNRLAVAIDPSENFIFAAGQDGRIRAWSLQSGQALLPPPSSLAYPMASSLRSNPFSDQFSQHVATMQVTEERDGMYLWAASDKNLFKYHLGQQRC